MFAGLARSYAKHDLWLASAMVMRAHGKSDEESVDELSNPHSLVLFRRADRLGCRSDGTSGSSPREHSGHSRHLEFRHDHASRTAPRACWKGILHGTGSGAIRERRDRANEHGPT